MAIRNKIDLKTLFKTGAVPSQKDFCDLIDSVLVKRDDHFFGFWNAGVAYHPGDVVLYDKSIYKLVVKEMEDCEDKTDTPTQQEYTPKYATQTLPDEEGSEEVKQETALCSSKCPPDDPERWCLLQLDIDDDDWKIMEEGEEGMMYAKVYGKIGMGTEQPMGRVDMKEAERGQLIFNPTDSDTTEILLTNLSTAAAGNYLSNQVNADYAEWKTNVPVGYVFKKTSPPLEENEQVSQRQKFSTNEDEVLDLMLITADDFGMPEIGIGTLEPQAMVDVQEAGVRQILLNTNNNKLPEILWLNLDPGSDKNYMSAKVSLRNAIFTTNADNGFQFKMGQAYDKFSEEGGGHVRTVLAIRENGRIGIGTENPLAHLQVTDQESGDMRVSLDNDNPALSIINLRPKTMDNYLTIGANNDHAVFVSDAANGFVFKKGGECGNGNEENINQGEKIVYIHPEGKVGIGIHPNEYELDVVGKMRAHSLHLDTDSSKIIRTDNVENVLTDLCKLNPIKFKWDAKKVGGKSEGEHLGFFAGQVGEYFPELVKTHADATKSVAYANMVAVLTQAIKEQQDMIKGLEQRIEKLEGEG